MERNIDAMTVDKKDRLNASAFAVASAISNNNVTGTFADRDITFTGDLVGYDFTTILRQKQTSIYDIYKLADYFVDSEELFGSCIKHIYTPFSLTDGWRLNGGDDRTREKYYEWLDRIHFDEKLQSWFYQYYLFGNVFFSIQEDTDIVTLPPNIVRISNVMVNGNPLVEINARSIKQDLKKTGQKAWKKFLDDEELDVRLSGYPKEVTEALNNNKEWVQLDARKTLVWQNFKPEWARYAIPMIVMCLKPFAKKLLISEWEDAQLQLGICGFIHASVGAPKDSQIVVDRPILEAVQSISRSAMNASGGLATTQDTVTYEVITPKLDYLFQDNKYAGPNTEILGALGISDSVASGTDSSVSFGASQVSAKVISLRITEARKSFCALMNRILRIVNGSDFGLPRSNESKLPRFEMPIADLTQVASFQSACKSLWDAGVLSNKTLLENYHIDSETEFEQKKKEIAQGQNEVFVKPGMGSNNTSTGDDGDTKIGRPTMEDSKRNSDPSKSETGRNPKPSNPEGSEAQTE